MQLCRSDSGSHPAPVPRCCGGAVRWKGRALPASCRHVCVALAACSGKTAKCPFRKTAGNRLGAGTGRRKQDKGCPFPYRQLMAVAKPTPVFRLPERDGQQPGTANSLDKSCAMVCHKSRKFLFLRAESCGWRRHPWGGPKGRCGKISAKRRQEADGLVQRSERAEVAERGDAGLQRRDGTGICRQAGAPHRAVAQKAFVLPDLRRNTMPEEETPGRVCRTEATQSTGMLRADGALHAFNDTGGDHDVVCRRSFPNKARWGGGGEIEGRGHLSR